MWEGVRTPRGEFGKVKHRGVLAVGTLTHNLQFANHPMIKDFKLDCSIFEDCPSCLVFRFWIPGPKNWVGSCPKQIVFEKIPYLRPILCKHWTLGWYKCWSLKMKKKSKTKTKFVAHPLAGAWSGYANYFFISVLCFIKKCKEPIDIFQTILPTSRVCLLLVPPKN